MASTGARRRPQKYPDELRERAVRMVLEIREQTGERQGAVTRVAQRAGDRHRVVARLGEPGRDRLGSAAGNVDGGRAADRAARAGEPRAAPRERHPQGGVGFLRDRARRSSEEVVAFIDAHRGRDSGGLRWGVEPICHALEIAPTTYWSAKTRPPCARARRDAELGPKLEALWEKNYSVYGRRKLTKAARKAGHRHRPRPGRPADASQRAARRQPSDEAVHDPPRSGRGPGPGSGQAGLHRHPPEREVGRRLHVLLDVVRGRLRRVHHRRVLAAHRRLEGGPVDDRDAGGRRVEHGRLDPPRASTSTA